MNRHPQAVQPATLEFDATGVPVSATYGDVYHSASGALAQARHVFLAGNHLPARWQGRRSFTVCETGFGLGQNFLASWQAWRDDPRRSARLHYLAFEAHPFSGADLQQALSRSLPADCASLIDALVRAWPPMLPGVHRLEFDNGALSLTLIFGPVEDTARQASACVDAFYLDGFSPARNPAMWSPALFGQLRRLAACDATVATWCAAGQVRRDLRDAGFLVHKTPGFGTKREMTVAVLRPGLGTQVSDGRASRVAVVGGGLAGAGVARSLALRGHDVQVYDPLFAANQASDLRGAAALVPALTIDDDTRSRLSRSGLSLAQLRWRALPDPARPETCGALVCAQDPQEALKQQAAVAALAFPQDWVRWLDASQAHTQAGVALHQGGLWFPNAMRVCPAALIPALLAHPGIQRHGTRIAHLSFVGGLWRLRAEDGAMAQADAIVLANASGAAALLETCQALGPFPKLRSADPLAGQVSLFRAPPGAAGADVPRCILSGKGYCLPPRMGWGIAGSTYRSGGATSEADAQGHRMIQAQLAGWLPEAAVPWLGRGAPEGWAGWRLATRDHLPIIGAVPGQPNLWLACAYGSRGLSWSALAGEVMAAQWAQEPVPLERELLARIRPR